jgi:hypothetical protein
MSYLAIGIVIGFAIGIAVGLNFGIIIGKKQKPWSELTDEERRQRKLLIGAGIIILTIGFLTGLWQYYSF